jgi:putative phosphoesterase
VKIAVLSDIHSNQFALAAVVKELTAENPDLVILLGDTFGYYPWAVRTYQLACSLNPFALLGNHDKLVIDTDPPQPVPSYWEHAKHNELELSKAAPEALQWLHEIAPMGEFIADNKRIVCCHGTPSDPLNGRFYPDNPHYPFQCPGRDEVLLMGHTHYPLVRKIVGGGLIVNPGSVGQPRDGDLRASWGWLFPREERFELRRTAYDVEHAVELLAQLGWRKLAIEALRKDYRGRLKLE